jgi:hypothetical protein
MRIVVKAAPRNLPMAVPDAEKAAHVDDYPEHTA